MVTLVGMSNNFHTIIKDLVALEYDSVEAYKVALAHLETPAYQMQFSEFLTDHKRHLKQLHNLALIYGVHVVAKPDVKQIITRSKVMIAKLFGDHAILGVMRASEDDNVIAYERACNHPNLSDEARPVMERGLVDVRWHRTWMMETPELDKSVA